MVSLPADTFTYHYCPVSGEGLECKKKSARDDLSEESTPYSKSLEVCWFLDGPLKSLSFSIFINLHY